MNAITRMGASALAMLLMSGAAASAPTNTVVSGTVSKVRSHDSSLFPGDVDWFTINTLTSSGTCKKDGTQVVLIIKEGAQGTREMSVITAAMLSGKPLTVVVNDSTATNGYCYALNVIMK